MPKLAEDHLDMSMTLALRFCKVTLVLLPKLPSFQRRIHRAILRFIEQEASVFLEQLQRYCDGGTIAYWLAYCPSQVNSDILQESRRAQEQQGPSYEEDCINNSSDKGPSQRWSSVTQSHANLESPRPGNPGFAAFSSKTDSSIQSDSVQKAQMIDDKVSAAFWQRAFARLPLKEQITIVNCGSETVAPSPSVIPSIAITAPTPTWSTTSTRSTSTSSTSSVVVGAAPIASANSDNPNSVLSDPPKSGVQHLIQRFNKPSKPDTIDPESVEGAVQRWRSNVHPVALPTSDPAPQMNGSPTASVSLSAPFSQEIKPQKPIGSTGCGVSPFVSSSSMNESASCSKDPRSNGKVASLRVLSDKEFHDSTSDRGACKRRVDITLQHQRPMHMEEQLFNDIVEVRTNMTLSRIFSKEPLPEKSAINTMNEIKQANFTKEYKEDNEYMSTRNSGAVRDTLHRRQSSVTTLPKGGARQSLVKSMVHRLNGALLEPSPMVPSTTGRFHGNNSFARKSDSPNATPRSSSTLSLKSSLALLEINQPPPDSASVRGPRALEPISYMPNPLVAVGSGPVSNRSKVKATEEMNTVMDIDSGRRGNVYGEDRGSKSRAHGPNFGVHDSIPKISSPSFNSYFQPTGSPDGSCFDATSETKSAWNINGVNSTESDDDKSDDGSLQYLDIDPHYEPEEWVQDNINGEMDDNDEGDQDTISSSTSLHSRWKQEGDIYSDIHRAKRSNDTANSLQISASVTIHKFRFTIRELYAPIHCVRHFGDTNPCHE
ncbi:hypothetical protein BGX26_011522 [Mortierella sp. AD094]|nr:hypothetical protein BGX26_011522 [Mortierella sp. AD094]